MLDQGVAKTQNWDPLPASSVAAQQYADAAHVRIAQQLLPAGAAATCIIAVVPTMINAASAAILCICVSFF